MVRGKNDSLWKGMLEESFEDLLRFVYPDADRVFDLSRGVEFLDKELSEMCPEPEKPPGTRFVDKLAKVHLRGDPDQWILCHVEAQGYNDKGFAKRMFIYYSRIFDRFPNPAIALALFTGPDGAKMPRIYALQTKGTKLTYKYNTLCIQDYSDRMLEINESPFALVMLIAKKALLKGENLDETLLKEKLKIAKVLIERNYSQEKTSAILSFLHNYIRFEKTETYRKFGLELDRLTGKTNTMGIIEQVKQMKIDEAKEEERLRTSLEKDTFFVNNLLDAYDISDREIASLAGVSEAFVKKLRKAKK